MIIGNSKVYADDTSNTLGLRSFLTTSRGALQPPSHHILEAAVTPAITGSCLLLSNHSLLSLQLAQLKSSIETALQVLEEILSTARAVFSPLGFHSLFAQLYKPLLIKERKKLFIWTISTSFEYLCILFFLWHFTHRAEFPQNITWQKSLSKVTDVP